MVLPWGANEFLGVTVITNLLSIFPFYGEQIVTVDLGCHSVGLTNFLNRFFLLAYIICYNILILGIAHYLYYISSLNNPLGILAKVDVLKFAPFLFLKIFLSILVFLSPIFLYCFPFFLNLLGHPENYIPRESSSYFLSI